MFVGPLGSRGRVVYVSRYGFVGRLGSVMSGQERLGSYDRKALSKPRPRASARVLVCLRAYRYIVTK